MLENLALLRDGRSKRCSSWDTSGRNADFWPVEAGETKVLADIPGAGVIRHIWFTVGASERNFLRQCVVVADVRHRQLVAHVARTTGEQCFHFASEERLVEVAGNRKLACGLLELKT